MGIASGVFWIMFGIGYVIYQSFKERPAETVGGAILFVIFGGAIASWVLIFYSLLDCDLTVATIFLVISIAVLIACFCTTFKKRAAERVEQKDKYQRALEIAKNEPIDEAALTRFEQVYWARPSVNGNYQADKFNYRLAKDKSGFRDLIIKDYIESFRVYQIMAGLDRANH